MPGLPAQVGANVTSTLERRVGRAARLKQAMSNPELSPQQRQKLQNAHKELMDSLAAEKAAIEALLDGN